MYVLVLRIQFSRENFRALILLKQVKLQNKNEKVKPLGWQIGLTFLLTEGGRKLTRVILPGFLNTHQSAKH